MRSAAALVVTLAAIAAAFASSAGGQREGVTLTVERYFDPACRPLPGQTTGTGRSAGCHKLRFSGRISGAAADEYVSVLFQRCGTSGIGSALAGTQTNEGGSWETEYWVTSGTFRARWENSVSDPVRYRDSLRLTVTKLSRFSQRVSVSGDQDMRGRGIELQRLVGGQWVPYRRARLVDDRISYGVNSTATFTVRRRGLVLRAFIPAKSAAPCYLPSSSEQWTSGVGSGAPGSGKRLIDRTMLCSTAMKGGLRLVTVNAASAVMSGPTQQLASFGVSSGFARSPGFASASATSFYIYPERCTPSGARVALDAGKLRSAPRGRPTQAFDCEAPHRVLVRVRAVFREPVTLESSRSFYGYPLLSAQGEVREAAVAVRTQRGRPLAFATFSESGTPGCSPPQAAWRTHDPRYRSRCSDCRRGGGCVRRDRRRRAGC
jgi:hypothetical protein